MDAGTEVALSASVVLLMEVTEEGSSVVVGSPLVMGTSVEVELTGMGSTEPVAVVVGADVTMLLVKVTGLLVDVSPTGISVDVALIMPSVEESTVVGTDTGSSVDEVMLTTGSLGTGTDVVGSVEISSAEVRFTMGSVGTADVVVRSVGDGRAVGVGIGTSDEAAEEEAAGSSAEVALMMGTSLDIRETMGSSGFVGFVVWGASEEATEVGRRVAEIVASVEAFSAGAED